MSKSARLTQNPGRITSAIKDLFTNHNRLGRKALRAILPAAFAVAGMASEAQAQFGSTLNGTGPVARSMAGTTTAAPVDTLGAFQWNPATITALPSSTDFGLEIMIPHSTVSSTVNAGSLAPGFPAATLSGSTESDAGIFPLPNFGIVHNPEGANYSYGVGVLSVGGFGVNYPGSASNPVLTPPLPAGIGVGPIYTQYQLVQVMPTIALQLTDDLSVGFSPIVNLASLNVDPGILAAPDNANGNGFPTYPSMNHGSFQWGAGFQVGAFYKTDYCWQFGAALRSPQWFSDFEYNSRDQIGNPRTIDYGLDAPLTVSLGTAYTGFDRLLIAVDGKFLNYSDTRGYETAGFSPTGAVNGLGWDDVFAVSTGVQYQATDFAALRLGYSFNTNPINDADSFYNVCSPLSLQHGAYAGTTWSITENFKVSLTYSHFFENTISGPIQTAGGPIPGTNVTSSTSADSILVGATVLF